jgi:cobalt-zinc-cadmium efflux system protein
MGHHHHHHHGHHHHHHHGQDDGVKNIAIAFFLNLIFTVFEIFGGFYVNSVSILSDALHDLGDSLALGSAWYLQEKSNDKPTEVYTFGYKRFSLLGALINSIILIAGSFFVIYHSAGRIAHPEPANAKGMMVFAVAGVLINGIAALRLSKGSSLNEKVLSWHLIEDVLGWVAVLIAGIVIHFTDFYIIDPLLSLLITGYILYNVWKRLKDTLHIFLQGAPVEIDLGGLKEKIGRIRNIKSIHNVHLWSVDESKGVFTVHVIAENINSLQQLSDIKNQLKLLLKEYGIAHATIDIELEGECCFMEEHIH